jgi:hypothetical protein
MKVYLSHGASDSRFAEELSAFIQAAGCEVINLTNNSVVGTSIIESLIAAMQQADVFVFLISKSSIASRYFNLEISVAVTEKTKHGKRVVPILLEAGIDLPPFLYELQSIRLFDDTESIALNSLVEEILRSDAPPKVDLESQRAAIEAAIEMQADISKEYEHVRSLRREIAKNNWVKAILIGSLGVLLLSLFIYHYPPSDWHTFVTLGAFLLGCLGTWATGAAFNALKHGAARTRDKANQRHRGDAAVRKRGPQ